MVQWLRTPAALLKILGLISRTRMKLTTLPLGNLMPSSVLYRHQVYVWYMGTHGGNTSIHKEEITTTTTTKSQQDCCIELTCNINFCVGKKYNSKEPHVVSISTSSSSSSFFFTRRKDGHIDITCMIS